MLIKKYILIFTLALISCAGTNYIHTLTAQGDQENKESNDSLESDFMEKNDVVGFNHSLTEFRSNQMI